MANKKFSKQARVKARRNAVQALYQWHITGADINDVINEFKQDRSEIKKADFKYFVELLRGVRKQGSEVESNYIGFLDRGLDEIDPVERSVLELGVYELLYHPELPWRIIINEYVELAKMFGAEDSHKYVNSIMDKAAQTIRVIEIQAANV